MSPSPKSCLPPSAEKEVSSALAVSIESDRDRRHGARPATALYHGALDRVHPSTLSLSSECVNWMSDGENLLGDARRWRINYAKVGSA